MPTGVIWHGPVFDRGGYGNVSRNYVLGLHRIGYPVRVINSGAVHPDLDRSAIDILNGLQDAEVGSEPAVVVHGVPIDFHRAAELCPRPATRRIGCTIFETDRIPVGWARDCNRMDEVWVPSEFNRRTFSSCGVRPERLRVIPYGVDTQFYSPHNPRRAPVQFAAGVRSFKFLYNFAYDYRKGADLLLEAYLQEFRRGEDVALVLKTYLPGYFTHESGEPVCDLKAELSRPLLGRVNLLSGDLPQVVVLDEPLAQEQLLGLYEACNAYVSTDRANGWGMPCLEAMALGKPVATIDWSGSTEFMDEQNSFLIHPTGKLEPVNRKLQKTRPIYAGHFWAEVEVGEVRRVLRQMYEDGRLRANLGTQALMDVSQHYSLERVAEKVVQALQEPLQMPISSDPEGSVEEFSNGTCESHEIMHRRGQELANHGEIEPALRCLEAALDGEPTSERWNDWAIARLLSQNEGEAEQGFRLALALRPDNPQALANLGMLLLNQGRLAEAVAPLGRAAHNASGIERCELVSLLVECSTKLPV